MKYLVQPLVPNSANAPGSGNHRIYAIASEHSRQVLTLRDELAWQQVPGGLKHVSVGADGTVWGVNANDDIWRGTGNFGWEQMPGKLKQISVGSATDVWGVNSNDDIYRWQGSGWHQVPGKLKHVSVARDGTVWGVNGNDDIWRWLGGGSWEQIGGKLKQISVGSRTLVWGVNAADDIFVRRGDHWMQIGGKLKHVSVAADGSVWGVNSADAIWRWRGGGWEQMPGGLKQISVGSATDVWGVNAADAIWRNAGAGHGRLVQALWTEDARQQWRLIPLGDGYFRIENVATGLALDVRGGSTENGADLLGWPWHGGHNQHFQITDDGTARFRITARHSGQVLDVNGASLEAGATVLQWPSHGGANQVWWLAEVRPASVLFDPRARIYEHANFQGASVELGVGSYDIQALGAVGNDRVSSLRVPAGVRVTLWEHAGFTGRTKSFTGDTPWVGDDFNDITSGVAVEKVVTIFEHADYQGRSSVLGVGTHKLADLGIPNDSLSSLRVPQGLMVTLFEHEGTQGSYRVYFEDCSFVGGDWNDRVSSIVVRQLGVAIPRDSVRYGGTIQLRGHHGKWLVAEPDGRLDANRGAAGPWETFTIIRAGASQHTSHVAYGDIIALRSAHGKYVVAEPDGQAHANRDAIGPWEKFVVVRSGPTDSDLFVSHGDVLSLRSVHNRYVVAEPDGNAHANREAIGDWERWTITGYAPSPNDTPDAGGGPCGAAVCAANICGAEACGADACGAEACGVDGALVGACAVAAGGITVCGVDVAVIGVCGAAATGAGACGAAACGAAACGADACAAAVGGIGACGAAACGAAACGAAACGADACGAAACGAEACGAAACSVDANPADACGADAGAVDVCPADACGANVCALNLCPADACAADACALDIIPIIPGI